MLYYVGCNTCHDSSEIMTVVSGAKSAKCSIMFESNKPPKLLIKSVTKSK